jgi:hypothetical protein
MRRRYHLLSSSLKIEYIERIRCLLDEALLKRFSDRWNGRQQRTSCDELQKCATIRHETSGIKRSKNGVLLIQKGGEEQGKFDRRWSVAAVLDAGDRRYLSAFVPNAACSEC